MELAALDSVIVIAINGILIGALSLDKAGITGTGDAGSEIVKELVSTPSSADNTDKEIQPDESTETVKEETAKIEDTTKNTNNPEKRTDYKGTVTNITINNYMRNIKVFFNYMFSEKLIRTNPVDGIKKLKANRKPKYYIKDDELIRLLNNFDETLFHEYRDRQITELLLDTRYEARRNSFN